MFIPPIKSKTQQRSSFVQTISLAKKAVSTYLFKKAKTTLQSGVAQPAAKMLFFERNNTTKMYRILPVIIATLLLVSCHKEELTNPNLNSTTSDKSLASAAGNQAPVVDAGPAERELYSTTSKSNSATLSGKASDAEGAVTVKWTQISGVSTATIASPTSATTTVSGLKPGVYFFVLTATDTKGVASRDTTTVSVFQKMTWTIEGVTREAWVHPSSLTSGKAPVIFAFHGHGQYDYGFSEKGFEVQWPEAIVVYPQGLVRKSNSSDDGKRTAWQQSVGQRNEKTGVVDDDLKFFDAMRSTFINSYHADSYKIFAHGWSTGGRFVYNVLWSGRGDKLAGLSPSGATLKTTSGKNTMPVISVAGKSDDKVPYSGQQKSSQNVRTLDKCAATGSTWATGANGLLGTKYASAINDNVVFLQYDGGHPYPGSVIPYIVKFFKEVK